MRKGKPIIIAEIGCNHKGDINIAKEMIYICKFFCKADAVKFQKRNNKELLSEEEYNTPHPNPLNSYGKTYGEHREYLEFTLDQHIELMEYCKEVGIVYSTSVWDSTSAKEITSLNPDFIKIPSAQNSNLRMLEWICKNYKKEIHISLGMTTNLELERMIELFEDYKRLKDVVLYCCTSGYPVPFEDVCLLEISKVLSLYGNKIKAVGFSGHHLGIAIDIAAMTLGAQYIERHFTLDRTWKGTDHAASLEPDGLRRLVRDVNATYLALTNKDKELLNIEVPQRNKLKYKGLKNEE